MTGPVPPRYRLDAYRFRLPPGLIAQVPAPERTGSRLMVLPRRGAGPSHESFRDLPGHLRDGDVLVVNDTRVIPARLFLRKPTGGGVELLVLSRRDDRIEAMYGTHRGLKPGTPLEVLDRADAPTGVRVEVEAVGAGIATVRLPAGTDARALMVAYGHVPLPPYIRRAGGALHDLDRERYQTVYAREDGAVAAPTAGLHFTPDLLADLRGRGVTVAPVTLHVGPGTFKPVTAEDVREHDVGEERFFVPGPTAGIVNRALDDGRRVLAVGTTAVRTLESAGTTGRLAPGSGATRLLITPGYRFHVVSGMVTNFHLPGSSLLLLVSAFAGRTRVLAAYREAVRQGYRFYSYGDAMLIA